MKDQLIIIISGQRQYQIQMIGHHDSDVMTGYYTLGSSYSRDPRDRERREIWFSEPAHYTQQGPW